MKNLGKILFISGCCFIFYLAKTETSSLSQNSETRSKETISRFSSNLKEEDIDAPKKELKTSSTLYQLYQVTMLSSQEQQRKILKEISLSEILEFLEKPDLSEEHKILALKILSLFPEIPEEKTELVHSFLLRQFPCIEEKSLLVFFKLANQLPQFFEPSLEYCQEEWTATVRSQALRNASKSKSPEILSYCIEIIKKFKTHYSFSSEEKELLQAAFYGLRYYPQNEAFEILVDALNLLDSTIINVVAESLAIQNHPQLIPTLKTKIENASISFERNAYGVFSICQKEEILPFLSKGVAHPNSSIQYHSILGFSRIQNTKTLQEICSLLQQKSITRANKLFLIQQISAPFFTRKENDDIDSLSSHNDSKENQALFLNTIPTLKDPFVQFACIKKCIEFDLPFDLYLLLTFLKSEAEIMEKILPEKSNDCSQKLHLLRIEAWQYLVQKTQQNIPLEFEIWLNYLDNEYIQTLEK